MQNPRRPVYSLADPVTGIEKQLSTIESSIAMIRKSALSTRVRIQAEESERTPDGLK